MISSNAIPNSKLQLSADDLLAISKEISQQYAPVTKVEEPEVVLMPVDPYHLQAHWNIGERLIREIKPYAGKDLALRIYWQPDESQEITSTKLWFDVAVKNIKHQLKVRLPIDHTSYSAALGRLHADHRFDVIVQSNSIQVPRARLASVQTEKNAADGESTKPEITTADAERQTYNEVNIASAITQTLIEKGFEKTSDGSLQVDNSSSTRVHFAAENHSGQSQKLT